MQKYIKKLLFKENLTIDESYNIAKELLNLYLIESSSTCSDFSFDARSTYSVSYQTPQIFSEPTTASFAQVGALLSLLASKGETSDEIIGFIRALKEKSIHTFKLPYPVLDIVGTGGDYSNTYNISTASALLIAACGMPVLKHGNRAVSSSCGSADVLEALGYNIDMKSTEIIQTLERDNFAFCFAPNFHPILAQLRVLRRDLGIPTIFNLLGPLLNPASPEYMIIGVNSSSKMQLFADILLQLNVKRALVVYGHGLDEISCIGVINGVLVDNGSLCPISINPIDYNLKLCTIDELKGRDAIHNAKMLETTLSGLETPLTDTVILNAGVALYVCGKVTSITEGVLIARRRILQGNILKQNKLQQIINRKRNTLANTTCKQIRKSFSNALKNKSGGAIICEIKRASPSLGQIVAIKDPILRAKEYVDAGADAISVLTDEGFLGTIEDLRLVAQSLADTAVPVLCKDFIFTVEQIAQAAFAGANAILLMVSVLKDKTAYMVQIAHEFGLETLVEIHHPRELAIALNSGTDLIGVNQRDLTDFSMHPELFAELIDKLPDNVVKVAESGIKSFLQAQDLYALGYNAVLVGEIFSRLEYPRDFFIIGSEHGEIENVN